MPIFAAEYAPPAGYSSFMECAFYTAAFIAAVAFALRIIFPVKNKALPQPLITKEHHDFVTVAQHKEDMKSVDGRFTDMQRDAATGRSNLHVHMEAVKTEMNGKIDDVRSEMSDIPEKTINILLKTKGLGL